jgi:hypothetical protein
MQIVSENLSIFTPKPAVQVCTFNMFQYRQRLHNLGNERNHLCNTNINGFYMLIIFNIITMIIYIINLFT